MKRTTTLSIALMLSVCAFAATPDYIIKKVNSQRIDSIWLLPDQGYDIDRVSSDTTLQFRRDLPIEYGKYKAYWIRVSIANPSRYGGEFLLWLHPQLENTFFQFDLDSGKWIGQRSGLLVADQSRLTGSMSFSVPTDTTGVYYILADVSRLSDSSFSSGAGLHIYPASYIHERETFRTVIWLATLAVVLVFFLYNAYVWYFFRDKTYLYYLMIQLGAMVYITGFHQYFNLLPWRYVVFFPRPNGDLYFYNLNQLGLEIGILLVMTGFIQLTRAYLDTRLRLPGWDAFLRYFNIVLGVIMVTTSVLTLTDVFYLSYYTVFYTNLAIIAVIFFMLLTGVLAMRRNYKPGKYFLLANAVPLIVMLCLAAYFAVFRFFGDGGSLWLPSLAIIAQSVALAVALVARVQLLKDELHDKEIAVQEEKSRNEKLREKLEYNQRELASSAMFSFQKNKLLADLKRNIDQLTETTPLASNPEIKKIKSTIQSNMMLDVEWEKFKLHFEQVHPDFFDELKANYPNLTQNEIRLSAYFKINLSVKEIAALLNIDPESVRKAKTRLNKKINQAEVNTVE